MLTPDRIRYANGVRICEKIIPDNAVATKNIASWVKKGQPMKPGYKMDPEGCTIHNTDDLANVHDDAEQYTRATYPNCNMGGVCVHFYVDDVGAWQNLREDESGWHAADDDGFGNRKTIAIEVIMKGNNSAEDKKAKENAIKLVAYLMDKYKWTIDDIYTHNHWKGLPDKIVVGANKNCPYYLLPTWEDFKKAIQAEYNKLTKAPVKESATPDDSLLDYDEIEVGSTYRFVGNAQYKSADSKEKVDATDCTVKVTVIAAKSKAHPIHVRSIDSKGNFIKGVFGWVDIKDLEPAHTTPYVVNITASALNIRSGPSTDYKVVSVLRNGGAYTIVEEKDGWGKLKSQIGWISLKYTKKI